MPESCRIDQLLVLSNTLTFVSQYWLNKEMKVNSSLSPPDLQSKGDSPSQHGLETKTVFDEDLQKKIIENERLHIQVS